jgi:hypothetical protein
MIDSTGKDNEMKLKKETGEGTQCNSGYSGP